MRSALKIMLVITRLDKGGSAELTLHLAAGLAARGHRVCLISGRTLDPPWEVSRYAEEHHFDIYFINHLIRALNPRKDLLAGLKILRLIKKVRPDIVHTNSSKAGILGRLAAHLAGVKKIFHSPHGHIFYGYYKGLANKLFMLIEKLTARYCDRILNLTEAGRKDHVQNRIAPPKKFVVSSCGTDLSAYADLPRKKTVDQGALQICWVGRIVPIKNLALLIRAASQLQKQYPRLSYWVVGDGALLAPMQQLAQQNQLTRMRFLGFRRDLPVLLAQSDIFIQTSINEGFGRTIVEAMAAGLPIIATRVGGVPDIVTNGKNGLLIPANDPQGLVQAVIYMIEHPEFRKRAATINRQEAQQYTTEKYVNNILKIYQNQPLS